MAFPIFIIILLLLNVPSTTIAAVDPTACANAGCPLSWLHDTECDMVCDIPACNYDGGDCPIPPTPPTLRPSRSPSYLPTTKPTKPPTLLPTKKPSTPRPSKPIVSRITTSSPTQDMSGLPGAYCNTLNDCQLGECKNNHCCNTAAWQWQCLSCDTQGNCNQCDPRYVLSNGNCVPATSPTVPSSGAPTFPPSTGKPTTSPPTPKPVPPTTLAPTSKPVKPPTLAPTAKPLKPTTLAPTPKPVQATTPTTTTPTSAVTSGISPASMAAWVEFFTLTNGPGWTKCSGYRDQPCLCNTFIQNRPIQVLCQNGVITSIIMRANRLKSPYFPSDTITKLFDAGMTYIDISQNMLLQSNGFCVDIPTCLDPAHTCIINPAYICTTAPSFPPSTLLPSSNPTAPHSPSQMPTIQPTMQRPSTHPTPARIKTVAPTITHRPSTHPTLVPTTMQPTAFPSLISSSLNPSHMPTSSPRFNNVAASPSSSPIFVSSPSPTHVIISNPPTNFPTVAPRKIDEPTSQPTTLRPSQPFENSTGSTEATNASSSCDSTCVGLAVAFVIALALLAVLSIIVVRQR